MKSRSKVMWSKDGVELHLLSKDECEYRKNHCDGNCSEPVKRHPDFKNSWYITMGHAGFNSPTNNAFGYSSKKKALAAMRRYYRN